MTELTINQMQPKLVSQLTQVIAHGQLAHGYLLAGAEGVGKVQLAQQKAIRVKCNLKYFVGSPFNYLV